MISVECEGAILNLWELKLELFGLFELVSVEWKDNICEFNEEGFELNTLTLELISVLCELKVDELECTPEFELVNLVLELWLW